jgi:serine/threonine protein kinase
VHGDLSGVRSHNACSPCIIDIISQSNILIDHEGKACLGDFGMSSFIPECRIGTIRWASPEALCDEERCPEHIGRSDIYSFGNIMLQVCIHHRATIFTLTIVLQVLSGRIPYHYLPKDIDVTIHIRNHIQPQRPAEPRLFDDHWRFILRCWKHPPTQRPSAETVYREIKDFQRMTVVD